MNNQLTWGIAILLSLLLHLSLLAMNTITPSTIATHTTQTTHNTRFQFQRLIRPTKPLPEKAIAPKKQEQKKIQPIVDKKLTAVKSARIKNETPPVPQRVETEQHNDMPQQEIWVQNHIDEKKQYIADILAAIEEQKFYPRAARQRGMEDIIEVSFVLMPDGRISQLNTLGAYKLLRNAAERAVKLASPFPQPPSHVEMPLVMQYAMAFQIKQ